MASTEFKVGTLIGLAKVKEQEAKSSVDFYMQHLSLRELKILEKLALELANSYSESYRQWKYEQ